MTEALRQRCDFCQSEFDWTADQLFLDAQLRLLGSGLGASCPTCDEKQALIAIREERRETRRERARELRGD